jgi:uncharacterized membrane protein
MPLLISRRLLGENKFKLKAFVLLLCWLIFFPNAAYLVTDIFHFIERPPVPKWFDLLIVTSAAWNGLMLSVVSMMQIEEFLLKHVTAVKVKVFVSISLVASAFGIYLGRFLRFNSWDIITDPLDLVYALSDRVINPFDHPRTWGFTIIFGMFLSIIYSTLKQLPRTEKLTSEVE